MERYKRALQYVKKIHKGQTHAQDLPVWHHLARVSLRLKTVLEDTKEANKKDFENIVVGALGHDLLEDTKANKKDIEKIFGKFGLVLIEGMTNTWGDKDVRPYVNKIKNSEEEVRLIKLADLCDNITSVSINLGILGLKWTCSYFLPVVTPMAEMILKSKFKKYKKTGEFLKTSLKTAQAILKTELDNFKK